jgi:hypothetical protein
MRGWIVCAVVVAGCSFSPGTASSPGSGGGGGGGGGPDAPFGATVCLGSGAFTLCVQTPTQPTTLTGTIDTDNCPANQMVMLGTDTEVCVVTGAGVTLGSGVHFIATGGLPLVIASTEDIDIEGYLDVSTQEGPQHGAGHNPGVCDPGAYTGANGAGGAGGSFATQGGPGGNATGGTPGMPNAAVGPPYAALRGGCEGGGGGNVGGSKGGTQGYGGGAVFLATYKSITIGSNATINASGECGYGGAQGGAGGSAGGSGGMILFDAPTGLTVRGKLFANGGGGGGGGGNSSPGANGDVGDQTLTNPNSGNCGNGGGNPQVPAPGGNGGGNGTGIGGIGGSGAATDMTTVLNAVSGQVNGAGGGGGGGGEGVIEVLRGGVPAASSSVSPRAIQG